MSSEGGSFSYLGYQVGCDWNVRCGTYADMTPILSVGGGPSTISISTISRTAADDSAVEFARALAREAQKFADETERIHAARLADPGCTDKAAGSDAA